MLGKFQQSHLRIELAAPATIIRESLLDTTNLRQWLWTQRLSPGLPEKLTPELTFTSYIGLIAIEHKVEIADRSCLRLLLSGGIDGYHEWCWGDGWVEARLEGISLLPLNLGQTISLLSFRQFVTDRAKTTPKTSG
ncbi:MAG: hypothetical protein ACFBSE_07160 [Prochloraceae cyanobacterium]